MDNVHIETLERLREKVLVPGTPYHDAVTVGIQILKQVDENPSEDAISRSDLKETIIDPLNVNDAGKNDWYEGYYTAKNEDVYYIDNAPAVPLPDFKAGYKQAILDGKTNYSKPQGEWIAREDMDYLDENKVVHKHFQCNHCGFIHDFIDGHTSQYNFCPQCGYRLEGGAE